MINLPIFPIVIPALAAVILMFAPKQVRLQRVMALGALLVTFAVSVLLVFTVSQDGILTVNLGNWPAPFGITLVSDMLSALLVTTSTLIVFFIVWFATHYFSDAYESNYVYVAMLFLLVGVNGAFTTGDIFNLFVFFEVFLISSYVLIVLGGKGVQLRESIKYLLVNVIASALFVMAVALLYGVVGTLSLADLAQKIPLVENQNVITVIGVLFVIVFGMKGALVPLHYWLPGSYVVAPTPILAMFGALLTKVGVYSILRTYTLLFDTGSFMQTFLIVLAVLTIVIGMTGAIAYNDVKLIIIYNIMIAVGVILYGIALNTQTSLEGALYYLMHDMLIKAALFMLVGMMIGITGSGQLRDMGGLITRFPLFGWTFFIAALSLAGIPPLSGFFGKLLIVQGGVADGDLFGPLLILLSSLFVLFSVIKIFLYGFWGEERRVYDGPLVPYMNRLIVPTLLLVAVAVAYGFGAEAMHPFITQAIEPLVDPEIYIDAVIKE
ncbi:MULTISPECIES: Na+/H+ antiporter subunit D [unclassified Exiguobacterium]|uniref:Na+/H+ antiporter subunit D n=1 Tax=unclassified Exiguobacterium TaxID=2644629 RepID=UPI00103EDED7|nr:MULTISPECIES: Na+/H+ antiporter subunit D [unclassified Exiguobacterium]TCI37615.1 Na+/H+ antiporter subunit D [Exiguobacterium sp. SH4S7]TCI45948.1 Na+/H+ antiporter subunit D [Exiguobacterium sp. SH5S32]TCI51705.1 Na+/H+ antiporter subunit D [Exiguobacterium sp. SH1S4]TCI65723.1 Na+/H+ antiporter subunit D [Exiguobacterium sp. SH0S2]TCI71691.1 Na+/H+ antiporter subunit D [Exiguobacterium sp. SH1S1]